MARNYRWFELNKEKTPQFMVMNGEIVLFRKAREHPLAHTGNYGSGLIEGIRSYAREGKTPAIFRLWDHINRIRYSAGVLHMDIPYSDGQLAKMMKLALKANNLMNGYLRPRGSYGPWGYELDLSRIGDVNVPIIASAFSYIPSDCRLLVSTWARPDPKSTDTRAKLSAHYGSSWLANTQARLLGYSEAIQPKTDGSLGESPGANVFVVFDEILATSDERGILPGITRDTVLKIADFDGIKTDIRSIEPAELKRARGVFLAGTGAEIKIAKSVDFIVDANGRVVAGNGKNVMEDYVAEDGQKKGRLLPGYRFERVEFEPDEISAMVRQTYADVVRGRDILNQEHPGWLEPYEPATAREKLVLKLIGVAQRAGLPTRKLERILLS